MLRLFSGCATYQFTDLRPPRAIFVLLEREKVFNHESSFVVQKDVIMGMGGGVDCRVGTWLKFEFRFKSEYFIKLGILNCALFRERKGLTLFSLHCKVVSLQHASGTTAVATSVLSGRSLYSFVRSLHEWSFKTISLLLRWKILSRLGLKCRNVVLRCEW